MTSVGKKGLRLRQKRRNKARKEAAANAKGDNDSRDHRGDDLDGTTRRG